MSHFGLMFFYGLIILDNFSVIDGQVCDGRNYTLIKNPKRSTMAIYDYTTTDIPLCDDGIDEALWYRFISKAGETLVERSDNDSVAANQCSTESPIYIQGLNSHPSENVTTTIATVCANYDGNPCYWTETIKIHRCHEQRTQSSYFLYQLKAPPGCPLSYCVGEKPSCYDNEYWNGFSCVNYFPPMYGFPLFLGPQTTSHDNGWYSWDSEVYFTCTVHYMRMPFDENARFRVTFLFDGREMERVNALKGSTGRFEYLPSFYLTAENSSTQIVLDEKYLRGRLGREISCKVESYWEGYEPGFGPWNSTMLISQGKYYATLESEYSSYVFDSSRGSTYEIIFRSTLPFTCRHCSGAKCCNYIFRMRSELAGLTCSLKWISGYTISAQVYILPGLSQSQVSYGMLFEPYNGDFLFGSSSLWRDFLIPPVMVEAGSSATSYLTCSSTTDPNINTFDLNSFSNFQVGDFYLVKTNLSMEIQVRQEVCSSGSCNCGVIVREGNSAIKISICEKGPWNATVQRSPNVIRLLSQDPVDSSAVYRDGSGTVFSLRMPSGLRVEIYSSRPWFNIYVYLPPVYHGQTSSDSLCGNSNGDKDDELQNVYDLDHYRIPDADNYFKVQPSCSSVFNAAAAKCDCANTTTFKCSNSDKLLKIVSKSQVNLPDRWSTGIVCRQEDFSAAETVNRTRRSYRKTRDADDMETVTAANLDDPTNSNSDFILDPNVVYPSYYYDPNYGVNVLLTWPTSKGKTELDVAQYCENMVNSSLVYQDCNASVDVEEIIRACKSDIQVTDEWLPGAAYASIFEENCVNQLATRVNSSETQSDSALSILTTVYEKTCPNLCSGHGTCAEANCVCNQGYIGTDCGIEENQPPLLTSIVRNGVCDVRLRPCDVISVFGSGISSAAALKCRFMNQDTGSSVETSGTFITNGEYSCPVPGTTTHRRRRAATAKTTAISAIDVSLTMNGAVYSNSLPFVIFDSICMECNDSRTCSQRSHACAIDGQCFASSTTNTNNRCLQCLPERSNSSWTDTTVVHDWKPCSRQCDYGARSRNISCSGTIESKEIELCKVTDCQGNKAESHQGVGITFSEEDLKKILMEPDKILNAIANALNSYCLKNYVKCCDTVGVSTTNVTSVSYTSPNLTTYASGYPMLTAIGTRVQIIVKIDKGRLRADCSETGSQRSRIVYAPPRLLYDVVSRVKADIERELGITIKSIWSPEFVTRYPVTLETVSVPLATATLEHVTPGSITQDVTTSRTTISKPVTPRSTSKTASTASATSTSLFLIIGTYFLLR